MSIKIKNAPPIKKPKAAGNQLTLPYPVASSKAGINKDQTEAAIIIPEAKPKKIVFTFAEISFLNK